MSDASSTRGGLWIDPAGWRYFVLPEGFGGGEGDLILRSLDGGTLRTELGQVSAYGVSAADVQDHVDEQVEEAFGYVLGALARLLGVEGVSEDGRGDWTLDDVDPERAESRLVELWTKEPAELLKEVDVLMQAVGRMMTMLDCLPVGHEVAKTVESLVRQMKPAVDAIDAARQGDGAPVEQLFALLAIIAAFDETTGDGGAPPTTAEQDEARLSQEIRAEIEAHGAGRPAVSWDFADLMKPSGSGG